VLKITRLTREDRVLTLKLEGEIVGPWIGIVCEACTRSGLRTGRLCLELAAVTYVDAAGVQLLCDLMAEGVEIAACSNFVGELLHLES
jgi:ABC-type transporter Mla MlaB component